MLESKMGHLFGIMLLLMSVVSLGFGLYIVYYNMNIVISWSILGLMSMDLNIILVLEYLSSFFCAVIFMISGSVFIYSDS